MFNTEEGDPSVYEWFWENCPFIPQDGPQDMAWESEADVTLYGGAAGGGKTALACGLAITRHVETLFIRREVKQLDGVADELERMLGSREGLNGQSGIWRFTVPFDNVKRKITLGSVPHAGDENRFQGRPRDLLVCDEAANLLESQVRFLMGWVRSTTKGQRCRTLLCSNPPTSAEGEWIIRMFAPWLDPSHDDPADPGELRWYAMIDGEEVEVENGEPFKHDGELVIPQSRTFIPARVQDNAYLMETGYVATLQALPEPLRSQMLYGDFTAGREDDEWQVIPSEWVRAAQARWEAREYSPQEITSVGCDPSRGGRDSTIIASRVGWWYAPLDEMKGEDTSSGGKVASRVVEVAGDSMAPVHVDVIGIGASVIDHLDMLIGSRAIAINSAEKSKGEDFSGNLRFANRRAELYWRFRDLLNPASGVKVCLPKDQTLFADLCAARYKLTPQGIQIEKKEDIVKRIGRSPDKGDAVIYAAERTPVVTLATGGRVTVRGGLDHG